MFDQAERERPPIIYRCTDCDHTHQRPYYPTLTEPQPCPECGQPSAYAWEWDGNRWNTLCWGNR